jgi:hypothetical protein
MYKHIRVPTQGEKIAVKPDFSLKVPDQPISRSSRATAPASTSPR